MAYDSRLFSRLNEIPGLAVQSLLRGDGRQIKKEKRKFLDGTTRQPRFSYTHIEREFLDVAEDRLQKLRSGLITERNVYDHGIAHAYQAKVEYLLKEVELLRAAREGDDTQFDRANRYLYGNVEPDLFVGVCNALLRYTKHVQRNEAAEVVHAARELHAFLERVIARMDSRTPHQFTWQPEKDDDLLNADEIRSIFIETSKKVGLEGWNIFIDNSHTLTSVTARSREKTVYIPAHRKLSKKRAQALAMHELGVHARRKQNGSNTSFKLLSIGLDHYLSAEEGLAKCMEQEIYPGALNSSLESYFFSGIVLGVDGEERSFRELFEIATVFFKSMHEEHFKQGHTKPEQYAWGRAERFFRGTTGQQKGVCSHRHLIYLTGYTRIKHILEQGIYSTEDLLVGKYDPTNPEHISLLRDLSIL